MHARIDDLATHPRVDPVGAEHKPAAHRPAVGQPHIDGVVALGERERTGREGNRAGSQLLEEPLGQHTARDSEWHAPALPDRIPRELRAHPGMVLHHLPADLGPVRGQLGVEPAERRARVGVQRDPCTGRLQRFGALDQLDVEAPLLEHHSDAEAGETPADNKHVAFKHWTPR